VSDLIPLWVKLAYTLFLCVLVPVYWVRYGPQNFLWFSDLALFGAAAALWLENRLLASMMTVGVLLPEVFWNVSFFARVATGIRLGGLTDYMFDRKLSRFLRGLSLFHVVLPALLVWMVARLGYDPRAWLAQSLLAWVVLPVTYLVSDPSENINWVFGLGGAPQRWMPPLAYLALLMVGFPLLVYLPTHLLLEAVL
jgi:hypothetical protein